MISKGTDFRTWLALTVFLIFFLLRLSIVLAQTCLADINNDSKVNYTDLLLMDAEMGRNNCSVSPCQADLDGDGKVNRKDSEILESEFGRGHCPPVWGNRNVLALGQDEKRDDDKQKEEGTPSHTVVDENGEEGISSLITRFKDNNDGTVNDPTTGLMWTQDANLRGDTVLFHQAINYIKGMNEGEQDNFGYTDWRLPTLKELQSLIEYKEFTSKGHVLPEGHPFHNVQSLRFYDRSAPTYLSSTEHSWFVYAYCSIVGHNVESCFGFIWPVRG